MFELNEFNHKITAKIKFHEVDLLGVCNNAVYFNYFEDARIEYVRNLGFFKDVRNLFKGDTFFIMARNECDYINPAIFDDEINIYTKIDFIKNSSFGFKHVVENNLSKAIIAKGSGVVVHIDPRTKRSIPLPDNFYELVKSYEKNVNIIKDI